MPAAKQDVLGRWKNSHLVIDLEAVTTFTTDQDWSICGGWLGQVC